MDSFPAFPHESCRAGAAGSERPRVGYACAYVPSELIEAAGFVPWRLWGTHRETPLADALLHPNVCPFVRSLLEDLLKGTTQGDDAAVPVRLAGLVLANSCDAMRRLHDVAVKRLSLPFISMIDVPRKLTTASIAYFREQLRRFYERLRDAAGPSGRSDDLGEVIKLHNRRRRLIGQLAERLEQCPSLIRASTFHEIVQTACRSDTHVFVDALRAFLGELDRASAAPSGPVPTGPRVVISGGILDETSMIRIVEDAGATVAALDTCAGIRPFEGAVSAADEPMWALAERYLSRPPCSRMQMTTERVRYIESLLERTHSEGLIYHTIKFCDPYAYDLAAIRLTLRPEVPLLAVESEYRAGGLEQSRTRIEAFVEMLGHQRRAPRRRAQGAVHVAGIDGGSLATKAVILDEQGRVVAKALVHTGASSLAAASAALRQSTESAGLTQADIAFIVATGYGRKIVPFADEVLTEIACHARGARAAFPSARTVIDIGGQDSKVIVLGEDGRVVNFTMNDKCAAGTGRFLELMARTLEVDLDRMGELSLQAHQSVPISSMCAVFAESEVVSLIAEGHSPVDIIRGLHASISSRVVAMVRRVEGHGPFVMTGGVARNVGVVRELEERLGEPLFVSDDPQATGALGAALFALERVAEHAKALDG